MRRPPGTPRRFAVLAAVAFLLGTAEGAWAANGIGHRPVVTANEGTYETHECVGNVLVVKRFRDDVLVETVKMSNPACAVVAGVQTPPAETGWVPVIVEVVERPAESVKPVDSVKAVGIAVPRVRQLPSTATRP